VAAKLDWIVTTNTIPLRSGVADRLPQMMVLSVANVFGEAIRRIHLDQSVSAMFKKAER
jgi:ribose-phosphate pyrophosphokinase